LLRKKIKQNTPEVLGVEDGFWGAFVQSGNLISKHEKNTEEEEYVVFSNAAAVVNGNDKIY